MDEITGRKVRAYDPVRPGLRSFYNEVPRFLDGSLTPRTYLERCLESYAQREGEVKAFVNIDLDRARRAADESTRRYTANRPLSLLDGMPVAVKDVIETEDFPTEHGSRLFAGSRPAWDAACIYWLKRGGAYTLGKTVTTEFAAQPPGPTRNPWDTARTPGGSSSGSAAAVGAGMAPIGLGTQVRGSVLRPAGYCGTYGLKPTFGVTSNQGFVPISRGVNHLGAMAGSLEDAWLTLHYISRTGGGEPGHAPLAGKTEVPTATKPARLARLETGGWSKVTKESKQAFVSLLARLQAEGVEIIDRTNTPEVEAVERMIVNDVMAISDGIRDWEARYPLMAYYDRDKEKLHPSTAKRIETVLPFLDPDAYSHALNKQADFRRAYAALNAVCDGCITLISPEPAPEGLGTGDMSFLDTFSVLGVPTTSLPLLAVNGLPLGVQFAGFMRGDQRLIAHARWISTVALS